MLEVMRAKMTNSHVPAAAAEDASAEANHRVANSLALIAGLVRMRAGRVGKAGRDLSGAAAERLLQEIAVQIQGVGLLHQALSQVPDQAAVDLQTHLQRLCEALQTSFSFAGRVTLLPAAEPSEVSADDARPIAVMVNELVTNAMKYAHPSGVHGEITVCCYRDRGGALTVEVADDGVGLPEGFDPDAEGNLGFHLLRSMSRAMNARLNFESTSLGLRVTVTLPNA